MAVCDITLLCLKNYTIALYSLARYNYIYCLTVHRYMPWDSKKIQMPYPQAKVIDQNPALCPASPPHRLDIARCIMFNALTCKVRFHIAVWSLSKSLRASSFIENFPQISAKLISFQWNWRGKLSQNRPYFTNRFSEKLASKIPAKSVVFSANLPLKIPWNLTFFPRPTRSPDCIIDNFSNKFLFFNLLAANWRLSPEFWSPKFFFTRRGD